MVNSEWPASNLPNVKKQQLTIHHSLFTNCFVCKLTQAVDFRILKIPIFATGKNTSSRTETCPGNKKLHIKE